MTCRINDHPVACSIREPSNGISVIKIIDIEEHLDISPDSSNLEHPVVEKAIGKNLNARRNLEEFVDAKITIKKEEIIAKTNLTNVGHKYIIMRWFPALIGCLFSFSTITLVPYHNVIEFPEYWYEVMFPGCFGFCVPLVYYSIIKCSIIMDFPDLLVPTTTISIFLTTMITAMLTVVVSYLVWTLYLGYNCPLPFIVYIAGYLAWVQLMLRIWYKFPKHMRKDTVSLERLKSYYYYILCECTVDLQFVAIQVFLSKMSQELQWITAIIVALTRELNCFVQHRFICKATGANTVMAKGIINMKLGFKFNTFVVILIGSTANTLTSYCLLVTDFGLNVILCCKIIRLHKKVAPNNIKINTMGIC